MPDPWVSGDILAFIILAVCVPVIIVDAIRTWVGKK